MPWEGAEPPFGFSPADASRPPWLPQPADWVGLTVEAQLADPDSTLNLHRAALRLRHDVPGLQGEEFHWRESPSGVLDFERGSGFRCIVNISGDPVDLDDRWQVLLASGPVADGRLPSDTAAWLTPAP
jgi:alpha-glucosidase